MLLALFLAGASITWGNASSWCWDPVSTSCAGNPTDVVAYVLLVRYLDPNPYPCTWTYCGEDCDPLDPGCCAEVSGICYGYTLSAWADGDRVLAPATCTEWDAPTPPLDAVVMFNVVAENSNGRGPMGACP